MIMAAPQASSIEEVALQDGSMRVSLLSCGAITRGWWFNETPLILGYDNPQDYLNDRNYLGAIVGRVANRIGGAAFTIGGTRFELSANEGRNTLHGGVSGLSRVNWRITQVSGREAVLSVISPDGDNGFPGRVRFEVRVSLEEPRLTYTISAVPDRPTPVSIAQHNYYSLGDGASVLDHHLKLAARQRLELDGQGVPSGRLVDVGNGRLDFREGRAVGVVSGDIDHYFVFDPDRDPQQPVAQLAAPSGCAIAVYSDQPGAQVYAGGHLSAPFGAGAGLCIEPSGYPNAVNIPVFPSVLCTPEKPYHQTLTLEAIEGAG